MKSRDGKSQRRAEKKKEDERREKKSEERRSRRGGKTRNLRNNVFFPIFVALEESKSRLTKPAHMEPSGQDE